jgi:hypothetical protein
VRGVGSSNLPVPTIKINHLQENPACIVSPRLEADAISASSLFPGRRISWLALGRTRESEHPRLDYEDSRDILVTELSCLSHERMKPKSVRAIGESWFSNRTLPWVILGVFTIFWVSFFAFMPPQLVSCPGSALNKCCRVLYQGTTLVVP